MPQILDLHEKWIHYRAFLFTDNEIEDFKKKLLKYKLSVKVIENNANDVIINTDITEIL